MAWEILITDAVGQFLDELRESDRETHRLVNSAIQILEDNGPMEGRPLVDSIVGSTISNLKELRPPSADQDVVLLRSVAVGNPARRR